MSALNKQEASVSFHPTFWKVPLTYMPDQGHKAISPSHSAAVGINPLILVHFINCKNYLLL